MKLLRVQYIPREFEPGVLYVSKKYKVAGHLCPCGCKNKIITPLGPTDWSFTAKNGKATLYPSIGNWQIPCRLHYWIIKGEIVWSYDWSEEQILAGRKMEEKSRKEYYSELEQKRNKKNLIEKIVNRFFKNKPSNEKQAENRR